MKFQVTFADGRAWIDSASSHGSAARRAIAEVYEGNEPDTVTITITKRGGGAVIVPAPTGE